jgi:hypothetical protein
VVHARPPRPPRRWPVIAVTALLAAAVIAALTLGALCAAH